MYTNIIKRTSKIFNYTVLHTYVKRIRNTKRKGLTRLHSNKVSYFICMTVVYKKALGPFIYYYINYLREKQWHFSFVPPACIFQCSSKNLYCHILFTDGQKQPKVNVLVYCACSNIGVLNSTHSCKVA